MKNRFKFKQVSIFRLSKCELKIIREIGKDEKTLTVNNITWIVVIISRKNFSIIMQVQLSNNPFFKKKRTADTQRINAKNDFKFWVVAHLLIFYLYTLILAYIVLPENLEWS